MAGLQMLCKIPYRAAVFASIFVACTALTSTLAAQSKDSQTLGGPAKYPKNAASVELLIKKALASVEKEPNTGLKYAGAAIVIAGELHLNHALADSYMALAKNYDYSAEPKNALKAYFTALNIYQKLNYKPDLATCYMKIAYDYYAIANYVSSLNYARIASGLAQQSGNKKLYSQSLSVLGTSYTYVADYPGAIACYLKQLKLAESMHDTSYIAKTAGNLGVVYYYLKKYPDALRYYNRCLDVFEQLKDRPSESIALNNIGAVYLETGDYLKAIDYNQRALTISLQLKIVKGQANDLTDISLAYAHLGRYNDAFDCLDKAIPIYEKIGAKNNMSIAYGQMASLYMDAPVAALTGHGINPARRYAEALKLQQKALQLAHDTKNLNNEADQSKNLSNVYERGGNYKEALKSYRNYTELKDSIFNDKKRQEITRLSIQYEYDKKEAGLKAKNAEAQAKATAEIARQKIIKNASIVIGLVLIVFGCITFVFYKRRKDAREKLREAELKTQVAETELKALRSQLNPHFIFNSLNSISDYIARHDKAMADMYVVKFAKLMRKILENSEQPSVTLANDLETLELYMQLEALRLDNKFLYQIHVEDNVDRETTMVPPMLLQPFVENSIWHGISPKGGCGKITIRVTKQGDMIEYSVEDNGIGREQSSRLKIDRKGPARKSFGIKVIQSRINMISDSRRSQARVELTDLDEGTRVSIKIPYESDF
ncbi:MAG: tetratricopeptide repeat protein [Bacteroidetes bacterium]|nr:tetratricopeptide repeat protein [Bacteroidota bacterium]